MTYAEILAEARKLVESGEERHLCYALAAVGFEADLELAATEPMVAVIRELVEPYATFGAWYTTYGNYLAYSRGLSLNDERSERLKWIDNTVAPAIAKLDAERTEPVTGQ